MNTDDWLNVDDILRTTDWPQQETDKMTDVHWLTETIIDPIHGEIVVDWPYRDIIKTAEFNRLKYILQLGCNDKVFSGATHSRFEHSVGTFYTADALLESLQRNQPGELWLEHGDIKCIKTAALCHDLGHGPFSHTFDNSFMQIRFPELNFCHEQASVDLFEYMIDKHNIDGYEKNEVNLICSLILGSFRDSNSNCFTQSSSYEYETTEKDEYKGWIYEVVNNKRNSMDVDKYDYLARDAYHIGMDGYGFDYRILTENARVLNNQICYPLSIQKEVYGLFSSRYNLFRDVYLNPVSQAAEEMVCDILLQSNNVFHFEEIVWDLDKYAQLTDNIIEEIRCTDNCSLTVAHNLIDRFNSGDLYTHVCRKSFTKEKKYAFAKLTPETIANFSDGELVAEDIRTRTNQLNFGMGEANPIDNVEFYDSDCNGNIEIVEDRSLVQTWKPPIKYLLEVFATTRQKKDLIWKAVDNALKELTGTTLNSEEEF